MEQEKLFHPTIGGSRCCEPERALLEIASVILHGIGWKVQQGFPAEEAVQETKMLIGLDGDAVIRACSAGLGILRRAADDIS